ASIRPSTSPTSYMRSAARAAGLPLRPGQHPVAVGVPDRQHGTAGVGDLHDVADTEGVEEPLGVRRGEVDAPVRDVVRTLLAYRPRGGVHELAVRRDPLVEVDLLLVVALLALAHPVGAGVHDDAGLLVGDHVRSV